MADAPSSGSNGRADFLVVSGMSGAGRSTTGNVMEDAGWYVIDNLPPQMLRPLLDLTGLAAGALFAATATRLGPIGS